MYEELIAQHSSVFQQIANHFRCTDQDIAINKHFSEGKSGDLVLLICVRKAAASQDCGSYVLKIFSSENCSQEAARTHMANEHTGGPSILTPKLRLFGTSPPFYLYDKAGDTFMQATSLAELESYAAANCLESLSQKLLSEWNDHLQLRAVSLHGLIQSWLENRRLEPGSRLSQRIEAQITDGLAPAFRFHEAWYPNPLYYMVGDTAPLSQGMADLQCALYGQVHGDLNEHNVIVQRLPGGVGYQFSLIDFEQYRSQAPLLFDQAYLLLCLLLQDAACYTLIEWSEKIEVFFNGLRELSDVEGPNKPPFSYMRAHISSMKWFINHQQEHNRSEAVWQLLAAHMAVGLNFVNKRNSGDRQQKMALLYTAIALRALLRSLGIPAQELADAPSLQASAGENSELWRQVDRFSFDNRYILLSVCGEEEGAGEVMQRLSPIKWSMVVEMNDLTDNPIRGRVLSMYKRVQGYRVYSIPTEEQHVFEPAPAWLHLNVSANQKNQKLYYARYFQKELQRCLGAVLSLRENEPLVIIADFKEDNLTVGQMLLQDILLCAGENTPVHIVSLNGISLDLDSEELLQCTVSPSTLEQLSQSVHLLFEAHSDPTEVRVPCKGGMQTLPPEMVANLSNNMVLVHRNITYGVKDDNGDGFYRGNEATWRDIENNRDVPRWDYETSLRDNITSSLERVSTGPGAVFKVFHRPGGGGTTLAKRIAWDFCVKYPTVILHNLSDQTAERLKELYSKTIKPLLVIVEVSDGEISQERISMLRRELITKSIRVLFLFVSRTTKRGRSSIDNTFYLPNTDNLCMSSEESQNMYERFSQRLRDLCEDEEYSQNILQRIEDLGLLTYEVENVELRQPFFYGLYTYGDGFHGITKYVERSSQGLSPDERRTVDILSMVTVFSQSVNLSFEEIALFLYPGEKVTPEVSDCVKDWIYTHELVIRRGRGSRVCHPVIAEEFLHQSGLICPSQKENIRWDSTDGLLELAIDFIDRMVDFYGADSRRLNDVFHDIFTHRTIIYEEESQKFSVLLTWLYTRERCTVLLTHLAKAVPWNPHYRNHLARLYLYPVTPEQQQVYPEPETALKYANEAIKCAKELDSGGLSIHYHVLGKAYTKQCVSKMREALATDSLRKALSAAEPSYINACDAFNKCIAEDKSGYGLTGKLELYSNILQLIKTKCGKNASLSTILTWKKYSSPEIVKKIASYISEGGDLINAYISQFDTSSAAFRSACIRFYSVIGKLEKLEMVFSANALTQKERCVRNRAIATVLMESSFREDKTFSYNEMSLENLRKVHALMRENIVAVSDNVQDRIRWLETFRRLPEFNLQEAYRFLMEWPDAEQNMFVCYYRYVVAFLMFTTTGEVDYDEVKRHLNQTVDPSRNAYGKNITMSLNYYGLGESPVNLLLPRPVPNIEDLKSDRIEQHIDFRKANCRIMRGVIETVDDGMLTIRFHIGHENDTFFAKSPNIYQISLADEGKPVQFVLGFSYSGMRSWDIQLASGT